MAPAPTDTSAGSDLGAGGAPEAKKPFRQILQQEIHEGVVALDRSPLVLLLSAFSAGLDIGFSLFLMAVVHTLLDGHYAEETVSLFVANMYAVGFIFVTLGRTELFTEHTTLAVLPVLSGHASVTQLLRLWGLVYVGNLVGTAGFAGMVVVVGPRLGCIAPRSFEIIAGPLVTHSALTVFLGAMFAGWLMGLLSWLVTAARDTISQIVIVWLIAFVIGIAHLDHPIVGSVEVLAAIFSGGWVSLADYFHYLLWATLGTALGGTVFVALLRFANSTREELPPHAQ